MTHTIQNQVENYFQGHGFAFENYMTAIKDLTTLAEATRKCVLFVDIYYDCFEQIEYLEDVVKEKFDANGRAIKND
jgi:hypothetical protein